MKSSNLETNQEILSSFERRFYHPLREARIKYRDGCDWEREEWGTGREEGKGRPLFKVIKPVELTW